MTINKKYTFDYANQIITRKESPVGHFMPRFETEVNELIATLEAADRVADAEWIRSIPIGAVKGESKAKTVKTPKVKGVKLVKTDEGKTTEEIAVKKLVKRIKPIEVEMTIE